MEPINEELKRNIELEGLIVQMMYSNDTENLRHLGRQALRMIKTRNDSIDRRKREYI